MLRTERVIEKLFADLKGRCVFNFVDDLDVNSPSVEQHFEHIQEVLRRPQEGGFTLNPDRVVFGATEIKYLGHHISAVGLVYFLTGFRLSSVTFPHQSMVIKKIYGNDRILCPIRPGV